MRYSTVTYDIPRVSADQESKHYTIARYLLGWYDTGRLDETDAKDGTPHVYPHATAGILKGTPYWLEKGPFYAFSYQAWNPTNDAIALADIKAKLVELGYVMLTSIALPNIDVAAKIQRLGDDVLYDYGKTEGEAFVELAYRLAEQRKRETIDNYGSDSSD